MADSRFLAIYTSTCFHCGKSESRVEHVTPRDYRSVDSFLPAGWLNMNGRSDRSLCVACSPAFVAYDKARNEWTWERRRALDSLHAALRLQERVAEKEWEAANPPPPAPKLGLATVLQWADDMRLDLFFRIDGGVWHREGETPRKCGACDAVLTKDAEVTTTTPEAVCSGVARG